MICLSVTFVGIDAIREMRLAELVFVGNCANPGGGRGYIPS